MQTVTERERRLARTQMVYVTLAELILEITLPSLCMLRPSYHAMIDWETEKCVTISMRAIHTQIYLSSPSNCRFFISTPNSSYLAPSIVLFALCQFVIVVNKIAESVTGVQNTNRSA